MFSLSTSWNSARHDDGRGLIKEIRLAGFDTIELGFSLTELMVKDIFSEKSSGEIKVSSIHNMCPLPNEIKKKDASPDYYSLASSDDCQRNRAVSTAKNTIEWAAKFGARAVILHVGRVCIKDQMANLALLIGDKVKFLEFRERMIRDRRDNANGYLDNVIKSLEELVPGVSESV